MNAMLASWREVATHLALILATGAVSLVSTALVAVLVGSRFSFWLDKTSMLLAFALGHILLWAVLWDGATVITSKLLPGRRGLWRRMGFFSLGPWPLLLMAPAVYFVVQTANITLISLTLLDSVTAWRDSFFWALEGGLFSWVTRHAVLVLAWETLYHSAWTIELGAVFLLFVVGRKPRLLTSFFVSFILIFYLGRLIGLVTPVMGPAFYQPELFDYLDGSPSGLAMEYIARLIAMDPADVTLNAALLGGVSAMPSLHIAMVGLTAYWLGVGNRKTMFFTVPWVLTVWASTVMLGWHYALDGAGGLFLAAGAIAMTSWMVRRWLAAALRLKPPQSVADTTFEMPRSSVNG